MAFMMSKPRPLDKATAEWLAKARKKNRERKKALKKSVNSVQRDVRGYNPDAIYCDDFTHIEPRKS